MRFFAVFFWFLRIIYSVVTPGVFPNSELICTGGAIGSATSQMEIKTISRESRVEKKERVFRFIYLAFSGAITFRREN